MKHVQPPLPSTRFNRFPIAKFFCVYLKLRRHERSHENDRRHQCCQCNKTYIRLEHLREHYDVVHKNQRLACPYDQCEARFTQRPALVTHVKKHREDPMSLGNRVSLKSSERGTQN